MIFPANIRNYRDKSKIQSGGQVNFLFTFTFCSGSFMKLYRYLLFALLYFAEGAVLSYFTALNAIYLRSFHLTMTQVGIFSAVSISPMVLKVFLGMLSDRVNLFGLGHRKPFIIIGLILQAAGIMVFPYIDPYHSFILLTITGFLVVTGMALYDTSTDGLALDTTPPEDVGKIQGIMVAGRAVGVVVISVTLGLISQHTGWMPVFIALAIMTLIPLPLVIAFRELPKPAGITFNWKAFRVFTRRSVIAVGLLGALFTAITNGTNQLVNPFLRETYGITFLIAGFYTAVWGVGVIIGGITGGRLADRFGHRKAVLGALFTALVSVSLLSMITGPLIAWPLLFLFGIAYGYYETGFFATAMAATDLRIAASMFSILMAMANIGASIGMLISGAISDLVGFRWTFVVFAAMNLLVFLLLPMVFPRKEKG
jgi:PAT family beta-lactamase induction signal transducer AmpG